MKEQDRLEGRIGLDTVATTRGVCPVEFRPGLCDTNFQAIRCCELPSRWTDLKPVAATRVSDVRSLCGELTFETETFSLVGYNPPEWSHAHRGWESLPENMELANSIAPTSATAVLSSDYAIVGNKPWVAVAYVRRPRVFYTREQIEAGMERTARRRAEAKDAEDEIGKPSADHPQAMEWGPDDGHWDQDAETVGTIPSRVHADRWFYSDWSKGFHGRPFPSIKPAAVADGCRFCGAPAGNRCRGCKTARLASSPRCLDSAPCCVLYGNACCACCDAPAADVWC